MDGWNVNPFNKKVIQDPFIDINYSSNLIFYLGTKINIF